MMHCTKFEIEVIPTNPPPPQLEVQASKYKPPFKCSWRTKLLAKPHHWRPKYTPPPPRQFKPRIPPATPMKDEQLRFRSDQISRGAIRQLVLRKRSREQLMGPKFAKTMAKHIERARKCVYNYYKERLRLRRNAQLKKLKDKKKGKGKGKKGKKYGGAKTKKSAQEEEKEKMEHLAWMAKPKKALPPPRPKRKWKPLAEMLRIPIISTPKEYDIVPPKDPLKIPSAALVYEITPNMIKLAQPDKRRFIKEGPPMGTVSKAALRYKATPNIERLAKPMEKTAAQKGDIDENATHWIISKHALKYKPTARILELAKPMERD